MKSIKEIYIHIIYSYYAILSYITKGKKSIVSKKLLYGAILIGVSSQLSCKQKTIESKEKDGKKDTVKINNISMGLLSTKSIDSYFSSNLNSTKISIKNTLCYFIVPIIEENKDTIEKVLSKNIVTDIMCYGIVENNIPEVDPSNDISFGDNKNNKIENSDKVVSLNKEVDSANITCYIVVETMPEFPNGTEAMIEFIKNELHYPDSARIKGVEGVVYVSFVVKTTGEINKVTILRGIGSGCDEEAIRVVKSMPNWKPGSQNETEVPIQFNLPIRFTLDK